MAGRPAKRRVLDVWMNGELVGTWALASHGSETFAYAPSWLTSAYSRPLSLSMPLTNGTTPFAGAVVAHYFDNLLPDSIEIRRRVAQKFGALSTGAFDVMEKIGRDCVGAVMLLPTGSPPPNVRRIDAEPLTEAQVARLLEATVSQHMPGSADEDELRISIAGAQEKTALLWHDGQWCKPHGTTATTHILKLPLGRVGLAQADFAASVENEWLCARIAKAFGLPAADSDICRFERHTVLAVKRFDRVIRPDWIIRLPQEDFCQVLGVSSLSKYESLGGPGISTILDRLRGSANALEDRQHFLAAQLLFWLLAAPDGHAKNFSLFLERGGSYRMTPLYDILSAWPVIGNGPHKFQWSKLKLAMALRAHNAHYKMCDIRRRHWNMVAKANALGADFETTLQHFITRAPAVVEEVAAQLPADFPAEVAEPIFAGLLAQVKVLEAQEAEVVGGVAHAS